MTKKEVTKKKVIKKKITRKKRAPSRAEKTEKILIENFVSLQKVMTRLSHRFDELTFQISELLALFEESAKVIVKGELKESEKESENKKIFNTMSSILDQNKVIAQGLTLMYEHVSDVPKEKTISIKDEYKEIPKPKIPPKEKDYTPKEKIQEDKPKPIEEIPKPIKQIVPGPEPEPLEIPKLDDFETTASLHKDDKEGRMLSILNRQTLEDTKPTQAEK